eukprot:169377_1
MPDLKIKQLFEGVCQNFRNLRQSCKSVVLRRKHLVHRSGGMPADESDASNDSDLDEGRPPVVLEPAVGFWRHEVKFCCCPLLSRRACCLFLLSLTTFILLGIYMVTPIAIQMAASAGTFEFLNITMSDPQTDRVTMDTRMVIRGIRAPFPVTMLPMLTTVSFGGKPIGSMMMDKIEMPAFSSPIVSFKSVFKISDREGFANFSRALMTEKAVQWGLSGSTDVRLFGKIPLPYSVGIKKTVELPGFDGFKNIKFKSIDVRQAKEGYTEFVVTSEMNLPSVVNIDPVGEIIIKSYLGDRFLGTMHALTPRIISGKPFQFALAGNYTDGDPSAFRDMIRAFVNGETCGVKAVMESSSIPFYSDMMKGQTMQLSVPGSPKPLSGGALAKGNVISAIFGMKTKFLMYNPFKMRTRVSEIDFKSFFNGTQVGSFKQSFPDATPMILEPLSYSFSPEFSVGMSLSALGVFKKLEKSMEDHFMMFHVEGKFTVHTGTIAVVADYSSRDDVPICWRDTVNRCPLVEEACHKFPSECA